MDPHWEQGTSVGDLGEFAVIARIRDLLGAESPPGSAPRGAALQLGAGDDAALLHIARGWDVVWTCDIQVEGRHFTRRRMTPREVGTRAAEVNLSDIAAMGAEPIAALVSLGLPPTLRTGALDEIYAGLHASLARHGACIAGGNITRTGELLLDISLVGRVEPKRALRRSGAQPGDVVFVTGFPGRAAAALAAFDSRAQRGSATALDDDVRELLERLWPAYTRPRARVSAGRHLLTAGIASAAIDLSDGLTGDLAHLAEESGAGIVIDERSLPVAEEIERLAAALKVDPLAWVLGASDDYELIFTAPREEADAALALPAALAAEDPEGAPALVTPIGVFVAGPARVVLRTRSGELRETTGGWDHLAVRDGSAP